MCKVPNDNARCFGCKHLHELHQASSEYTCQKPDKDVRGDHQGYQIEWLNYPFNFNPRWMITECKNFEQE